MPNIFEEAFKRVGISGSKSQKKFEKKQKQPPAGGKPKHRGEKPKHKGEAPPPEKNYFYLLPKDTRQTIEAHLPAKKYLLPGNFSLNFYRLLPCEPENRSTNFKEEVWQDLSTSYQEAAKRAAELLKVLGRRLAEVEKELHHQGLLVKKLFARTQSRLVIGLGLETVLEAGLALNRVYGLPYLPGSALKGLCRAYWREALFAALGLTFSVLNQHFTAEKEREKFLQKAEEFLACAAYWRETSDKKTREEARKKWSSWVQKGLFQADFDTLLAKAFSFSLAFGSQSMAGALRVSDFLPEKVPNLELDIINCHYPSYYTNSQLPTEWENPVPVTFAVVPEKARFQGLLWLEPLPGVAAEPAEAVVEEVVRNLREALLEWGLGGKTAVGYGRLELTEAPRNS